MKAKIILFMLAGITLLFPACYIIEDWGNCSGGPIRYGHELNGIDDILCENNGLCGKERNIYWGEEGNLLKVGFYRLFFQANGKDTLPLGIEYGIFYLFGHFLEKEDTLPPLFSDYGPSTTSLRIALKDDIETEERNKIFNILSDAKDSRILIRGEIRFYKSKDDPYFDSRHDILPELVISNSEDFFIREY